MISVIVAVAVAAVYLARSWLLAFITPKGIRGIPAYPDPSPLLGDLSRLAAAVKETNSFSKFFDRVGHDLGPVAQLRLTPLKTMVVVSDYQETESILNRHHQFERADHTASTFTNIVRTGQIALKTNDMWKQHRRLIGPVMTSKALGMMMPNANQAVGELIELFQAKADKAEGKAWEVEQDFVSSAMVSRIRAWLMRDTICGMAFGKSWGVVKQATQQVREGQVETGALGEAIFSTHRPEIADSTIRLLDSVPIKSSFPGLTKLIQRLSPGFRHDRKLVFGYLADKLAESRRRGEVEPDNTLDMMVARESTDSMPDNEILDEIFLWTETTAVTLTWYLKFMTNHPEVQRKLRAHLLERTEIQARPLAFEDLAADKVPYLEAVVQECLRKSRTAGGTAREAKIDTSILGYAVPKGTIIIMPTSFQFEDESHPTWGGEGSALDRTHSLDDRRVDKDRRVGFWQAAHEFDPERWLRNGEFDANAGPSLPFSHGQRGCFGKNLALLELRLVIAQLTVAFFFAPVEEKQNSQDFYEVITAHPKQSFIRPVRW